MNALGNSSARGTAKYSSIAMMILLMPLSGMSACTSDRKTVDTGNTASPLHVDGLKPYPENSVVREASKYLLRMDRVREWYAIVEDVNVMAKSDSTLHIRLDYSFANALAPHVEQLQRLPAMVAVLDRHEMSAKEFVLLTTLVNTGWGALALIDSLGVAAAPINVGPNLVDFMRANRRELDSLRARSEGR